MSATAFHWIEPKLGYPKAAAVLKDTGSLAIFSNEHPPLAPEFAAALYQIEQRIIPTCSNSRIEPILESAIAMTAATINATQLFAPVIVKTYPWTQTYTTTAYLRLLNTYSNYRNLEAPIRRQLFEEIAALINQRYAGSITKSYLAVLYLAQKRSPV